MFVQIIRGRSSDAAGIKRQITKWDAEVRPGADGFLGGTTGVSDDGEVVILARFEDEEAAGANNERTEQGDWWAETEKLFDGDVTFANSTDVIPMLGGGSDDAGFVQVMEGTVLDRAAADAIEAEMESAMKTQRPDLLGGLRMNHSDGRFTDASYFTSEAAAREGESKDMPDELAASFEKWQQALEIEKFIDLTDPLLT